MEIWRAVVGYEGFYEVSNLGQVRSLPRVVRGGAPGSTRLHRGGIKKQGTGQYPTVQLTVNGAQRLATVHRLVAQAFVANPDNKPEVNHKNGIKSDNVATNLEWATVSENAQHAHLVLGTPNPPILRGVDHHNAKLDEDKVRAIRTQLAQQRRQKDIASDFGVDRSLVGLIARGKIWTHVGHKVEPIEGEYGRFMVESTSEPGEHYVVDVLEGTCGCKGFSVRKRCSHLTDATDVHEKREAVSNLPPCVVSRVSSLSYFTQALVANPFFAIAFDGCYEHIDSAVLRAHVFNGHSEA